VVSSDHGFFY